MNLFTDLDGFSRCFLAPKAGKGHLLFCKACHDVVEVDRNLLANAEILGARGWQLTRSAVIPSAMSWIFVPLHASSGFAMAGAIVIIMVVALAAEHAMTLVENAFETQARFVLLTVRVVK